MFSGQKVYCYVYEPIKFETINRFFKALTLSEIFVFIIEFADLLRFDWIFNICSESHWIHYTVT